MLESEINHNPMFDHSLMRMHATTTFMDPSSVLPIHNTAPTYHGLHQQQQSYTSEFPGYMEAEASSRMNYTQQHSFPTSSHNYRYDIIDSSHGITRNTPLNVPAPSMSTYYPPQSYMSHSISQPAPTQPPFSMSFSSSYHPDPHTLMPSDLRRDIEENARPMVQPHNWNFPQFPPLDLYHHTERWLECDSDRKWEKCQCPSCRGAVAPEYDTNGKRLHLCHVQNCNKMYNKTSHLKAHLRLHTGERPYVCDWLHCAKTFTRSDELKRHKRTHTGEKKYECCKCDKKFMRSDHRNKHIKTHNNRKGKQNAK